jgi:hypothetical protein
MTKQSAKSNDGTHKTAFSSSRDPQALLCRASNLELKSKGYIYVEEEKARNTSSSSRRREERPPTKLSLYSPSYWPPCLTPTSHCYSAQSVRLLLPPRLLLLLVSLNAETAQSRAASPRTAHPSPSIVLRILPSSCACIARRGSARLLVASVSSAASLLGFTFRC